MRKLPIVGGEEAKTLMPEVLPQPTPAGAGSPRERTVSHMRKLLAAAAVAGVAATTTRSEAVGDGGGPDADASAEAAADDGGPEASADGAAAADAGADGGDAGDASDAGYVYGYDARPGYDPVGNPPPTQGGSQSSGCGCEVVGKKR